MPTGNTVALVTEGGKRSLLGPVEMANYFSTTDLEKLEDKWKKASFIFQASWFFLSPDGIECAFKMATHAAENGQHFGLNLAAESLVHKFRDELVRLMQYTSFVFGNTVEYEAFAQAMEWDYASVHDILHKMDALSYFGTRQRTFLVTSGSSPTLMLFEGSVHEFPVNKVCLTKSS